MIVATILRFFRIERRFDVEFRKNGASSTTNFKKRPNWTSFHRGSCHSSINRKVDRTCQSAISAYHEKQFCLSISLHSASIKDAPVPYLLNNMLLSWENNFAQDQYQWPAHSTQQKRFGQKNSLLSDPIYKLDHNGVSVPTRGIPTSQQVTLIQNRFQSIKK
jgi:hypothetical protein